MLGRPGQTLRIKAARIKTADSIEHEKKREKLRAPRKKRETSHTHRRSTDTGCAADTDGKLTG